jgi:hypothetical protein
MGGYIANKDVRLTLYVHNLAFFFGDVDTGITPKDSKIANIRFSSTPSFFWGHTLNSFVRCAILNIVGTIDNFSPKLWGKTSRMDHAIFHLL